MDFSVTNCQSHNSLHGCHSSVHHHHNHHHHYHRLHHLNVLPHCPIHRHFNSHSPACPFFTWHPPSQNPQPSFSSVASMPNALGPRFAKSKVAGCDAQVMHEQNEELEEQQNEELEEEEEEEEDPVFVLTDEWREFFAKSEAKRRLAKKQAKKKGGK